MGNLVQSEIQMDFPNIQTSYCNPVVVYSSLLTMFTLLMTFIATMGSMLIYLWQALTQTKSRPKRKSAYYYLEPREKIEREKILKDLGLVSK